MNCVSNEFKAVISSGLQGRSTLRRRPESRDRLVENVQWFSHFDSAQGDDSIILEIVKTEPYEGLKPS